MDKEPDISQFDDAQIAQEMQEYAKQVVDMRKTALRTERLIHGALNLSSAYAIDKNFVENHPTVNMLIDAATAAARVDETRTNVAQSLHFLLAATWRMSKATIKAVDIVASPTDSDDAIEI